MIKQLIDRVVFLEKEGDEAVFAERENAFQRMPFMLERILPAASGWRAIASMALDAVRPWAIAGAMVLSATASAAASAMIADEVIAVSSNNFKILFFCRSLTVILVVDYSSSPTASSI